MGALAPLSFIGKILNMGQTMSKPVELPPFKTEQLQDGCVLVSLDEGDKMVSTIVSSMHLVEDKYPQLIRAWLENEREER